MALSMLHMRKMCLSKLDMLMVCFKVWSSQTPFIVVLTITSPFELNYDAWCDYLEPIVNTMMQMHRHREERTYPRWTSADLKEKCAKTRIKLLRVRAQVIAVNVPRQVYCCLQHYHSTEKVNKLRTLGVRRWNGWSKCWSETPRLQPIKQQ